MIPGAVHRSPGICLKLRKFLEPVVRRPSDERWSSSQIGTLPPNEISRITQHVRKGEGRKEGKDGLELVRI